MSTTQTDETSEAKWTAALADDRIVIVTIDAELDARIRDALRDEPFELISVPNFEENQGSLINTSVAIVDAVTKMRRNCGWETLEFIRHSRFWRENYPLIGLVSWEHRQHPEYGVMMGYPGTSFDIFLAQDFDKTELVKAVRRIIEETIQPTVSI